MKPEQKIPRKFSNSTTGYSLLICKVCLFAANAKGSSKYRTKLLGKTILLSPCKLETHMRYRTL